MALIKKLLSLLILAGAVQIASAQIVLTGFGTGQIVALPSSTFATTVATNDTSLLGVDNNFFYGDIPPVDISDFLDAVTISGTFNVGTATSNFQIQLFDSDGDARLYAGNWTSFVIGVPMTVKLAFVGTELGGSGSFSNVVSRVGLTTGGSGLGTINFTANTLTAVPEPSSWTLLGFAAVVGILVFRRFASAKQASH